VGRPSGARNGGTALFTSNAASVNRKGACLSGWCRVVFSLSVCEVSAVSNNTLAPRARNTIHSTQTANFVTQREASSAIGVSPAWLSERKSFTLYAPALRLGTSTRYSRDQIRLWLAVASGNQSEQDASAEWQMIRASIGRRELRIQKRA
jgi:hypothetical protein